MKDIINHNNKLQDYGLVSLVEESKAMYSKSPPKFKDLGSFTVPCVIGGTHFDKALEVDNEHMEFDVFKIMKSPPVEVASRIESIDINALKK